ncbi:hypothetical protein FRC07_010420 [Ceratobasidium sp. 392]|nr:hypothetical protein FRC07_010420 [Ceratobasidium sp. 392]
MAGKMKRRVKQTFKKLLCNSSSDFEPSAPSTQQAGTQAAPVPATNPPPTTEPAQPVSSPPIMSSSNVQSRDSAQHPAPASISPAPPPTNQSVKYDGWAGLLSFSRLIIEGSAAFGPLKEVVDGILASIDTFETAGQNREDYDRLRTELNTLFHDLAEFFGASTPPAMNASIVSLAHGIEQELTAIRQKRQQRGLSRVMNAMKDEDMILEHYRRVQRLLERLKLNANMNMWKVVDEQATVCNTPPHINHTNDKTLLAGKSIGEAP